MLCDIYVEILLSYVQLLNVEINVEISSKFLFTNLYYDFNLLIVFTF